MLRIVAFQWNLTSFVYFDQRMHLLMVLAYFDPLHNLNDNQCHPGKRYWKTNYPNVHLNSEVILGYQHGWLQSHKGGERAAQPVAHRTCLHAEAVASNALSFLKHFFLQEVDSHSVRVDEACVATLT